MIRHLLVSAACGLALGALLTRAAPDPGGRALFEQRCSGCHALDHEKSGPRLGGVFGRRAGTVAGFPYSDALRSSNIIWNAKNLDGWLADPERLAPGNDMAFRLENAQERARIIDYLSKATSRLRRGRVRLTQWGSRYRKSTRTPLQSAQENIKKKTGALAGSRLYLLNILNTG